MYVIYKNFQVHRKHNILPTGRKSFESSMAAKFERGIEGPWISRVETFAALFRIKPDIKYSKHWVLKDFEWI